MKQNADRDLVQGLIGKSRRFVSGGNRPLFLDITHFFPDNLPDLLPILFRLIWEQHGVTRLPLLTDSFNTFRFRPVIWPLRREKRS